MSRQGKRGRPPLAEEIRDLIRTMSAANPTWGSPRIVGELRKLGLEVAKATVDKYRVRPFNAALAQLADLSHHSCQGPCLARLFHRRHGPLRDPVRADHPRLRARDIVHPSIRSQVA